MKRRSSTMKDNALRGHFGLGIERDRVRVRSFVHQEFTCTIDTAGRRKNKAIDACTLTHFDQQAGGRVVNFISQIAVDRTSGVPYESSKVDYSIDSLHGLHQ